jgi:hypothetical protein
VGIAEAAERVHTDDPLPLPHEVKVARAIEKWGNPYGPWTEWPAGMMYKMQTAVAVWELYYGGIEIKPGGFGEWAQKNPGQVRLYMKIEKLRNG